MLMLVINFLGSFLLQAMLEAILLIYMTRMKDLINLVSSDSLQLPMLCLPSSKPSVNLRKREVWLGVPEGNVAYFFSSIYTFLE